MSIKSEYKEYFTIMLSSFEYAVMKLDKLDYKCWEFMKKAKINSMNVKYKKPNIIKIEIDSVIFL